MLLTAFLATLGALGTMHGAHPGSSADMAQTLCTQRDQLNQRD